MKPEAWHNTWSQVDQTEDPGYFVRFLDATRLPQVRAAYANPRRYFQHLDLRPGDNVLEVGCGTGDMLIALSELVEPGGRVVGVDASRAMIGEATRRAAEARAKVEFFAGDAERLDLPSDQFDRTFVTSVLQHLEAPEKAVAEMVRVTRPGGTILINETDWDTQVVHASDIDLTRRILRFYSDSVRNGLVARRIPAMMSEHGLTDVRILSGSLVSTDPSEHIGVWLCETARRAASAGAISHQEAEEWVEDIAQIGRQGGFFAAFTTFHFYGTKPANGPGETGAEIPKNY